MTAHPASAGEVGLIVASNRLPVTVSIEADGPRFEPSSGGLIAAVAGLAQPRRWIGWPGTAVPAEMREPIAGRLAADGLVPVFLPTEEEQPFYRDICNDALWPLFHYFTSRFRFHESAWTAYEQVNRRFAEAVLAQAPPGAQVWIHDYHLLLLPRLLREQRSDLEIGFFLHIPFPSSEVYRLLPPREEVLLGMLGADHIGFHTSDYLRHFRMACLRVLGIEPEPDAILHEGRRVGLGVHPIGIDVEGFQATLGHEATRAALAEIEQHYAGRRLLLSVERLDYSKGVPHKLLAYERFLARDRERAQSTTLLQVLVPSRLEVDEYRLLRQEIEREIGRINGQYGRPGRTPIEYLHRSVSPTELAAMYRRADVMLVTPVRDGMNLIAQEFVFCQGSQLLPEPCRGVLVLSEFAGAAQSLARALLVNPSNVPGTADAIEQALAMSPEERVDRMQPMAERVAENGCRPWAARFLRQLRRSATRSRELARAEPIGPHAAEIERRFATAAQRALLLDYDGTLREIMRDPDHAVPTREIKELLRDLAGLPGTEVHVVSGRRWQTLQAWFGGLPLSLCAEHGFMARPRGAQAWEAQEVVDLSWMREIRDLLERVTDEVPGSLIEPKNCSIAWHYRMADFDYGVWRARELLGLLEHYLKGKPVHVLHGNRVLEIRARGVDKGAYVRRATSRLPAGAFLLCAGDDQTDEDMYKALPPEAVTINVGGGRGGHRFVIETPLRLRALLRRLLAAARRNHD
jgi:trehalose 6-phosphate synthase/phosphatase